MRAFLSKHTPKLIGGLVFLLFLAGIIWSISSAVRSSLPVPELSSTDHTSPAISLPSVDTVPKPTGDSEYDLERKGNQGVDVSLHSKSPFRLHLPSSLDLPVTVALRNNRIIGIVHKDGSVFRQSDKDQNIGTPENKKLLDIIQKDPVLSTYSSGDGRTIFYTGKTEQGEEKQWLFKHWTLYDKQKNSVESVSYTLTGAVVTIDGSGSANVFFDDGTGPQGTSPDFTVPKPYILDKDGNKTDLNWHFDQATKILSTSFVAQAESYPIALDPSILKTDAVIATFSGKTVSMGWPCGGTVTDIDGNTYGSVQIGTQCWMTSNMMTTRYPDGTAITRGPVTSGGAWNNTDNGFYAYPPNTANTAEETLANIQSGKLGFVYQWSATMYGSVTAGVQGICPSRWHVPTHDEYTTMERAVCTSGSCTTDFPFDTSTIGWRGTNEGSNLSTETSGGTNSSGFTGHLAGYRGTDGPFRSRGSYAYLWSSSQSGGSAWHRYLNSGSATVNRGADSKAYGFSVRCLKD